MVKRGVACNCQLLRSSHLNGEEHKSVRWISLNLTTYLRRLLQALTTPQSTTMKHFNDESRAPDANTRREQLQTRVAGPAGHVPTRGAVPVRHEPTRVAVPERNALCNNQALPTRVAQQTPPATARHVPHYTGYDPAVENGVVCRCVNPVRHGDAFSTPETSERYNGLVRRDQQGNRMTMDEVHHRRLDILGKDSATREELDSVNAFVFHTETAKQLDKQKRHNEWANKQPHLNVRNGIAFDAIWYGRKNPKGCFILPPPETPDLVMIGPEGGYRPGARASAQGSGVQGRATRLGLTWGESQLNNGSTDTSGRAPSGRAVPSRLPYHGAPQERRIPYGDPGPSGRMPIGRGPRANGQYPG